MEEQEKSVALLHSEVTGRILGVFFDVYYELGYGFREFVYRRAMLIALSTAGLDARSGMEWPVWFRGARIATFEPDIVVTEGPVLIELKAKPVISSEDVAQTLSYLKGTDIEVALILNFGKRAEHLRRVFQNGNKQRGAGDVAPDAGGA